MIVGRRGEMILRKIRADEGSGERIVSGVRYLTAMADVIQAMYSGQLSYRLSRMMVLGLIVGLLGMPAHAQALGFGTMTLQSHLGEGLKADIPVILDATDDIQNVRIGLASQQEYRQTGLQWQAALSQVRVSVQGKHLAQPWVELRSSRIMQSPMLSVLLKFSKAGRGTYYKHFKILLDPAEGLPQQHKRRLGLPLSDSHASDLLFTDLQASDLQAVNPSPSHELASIVLPGNENVEANRLAAGGWARLWRYGPVRAGDSLNEIARRLQKDQRFSQQQVLLALYEENPNAFIDADINQLQQGVWLTVPRDDTVKKYTGAAAMQKLSALLQGHDMVAGDTHAPASEPAHYRGKVSLNTGNAQIDGQMDALKRDVNHQLDAMHAEMMDGKLQMTDLNASVVSINQSMHRMQADIHHLKSDMAAIKAGGDSSEVDLLRYWKLLLAAVLAGIIGGWITNVLGKKLAKPDAVVTVSESDAVRKSGGDSDLDGAHQDSAMQYMDADFKALNAAPEQSSSIPNITTKALSPLADEVIQLLNQAEAQLGACEFEPAEALLQRIDEKTPGSLRAAALKAQLYHETDRFDQRNNVINEISETSDKQHWERFCTLLPSQVWNACFGSGLPE